jgi:hypothetical protein
MIVSEICVEANLKDYKVGCMVMALEHDLMEILEGDIPSPAKGKNPFNFSGYSLAETIVKAADVMEMYYFIHRYKIDSHGKRVEAYCAQMYVDMCRAAMNVNRDLYDAIVKVNNRMFMGEYTI